MTLEGVFSLTMLAGFLWAVRVMLPRAVKDRGGLALTSALLTAALTLLGWLFVGVRVTGRL